jgi:indole-3-glycerol phosphate synthase
VAVLDEILATKRDEVTMLHRPEVRDLLHARALAAPPPRDFAAALRRPDGRVAVIGEIKRRSPSKGDLAPDLDPGTTAKAYEAGGVSALSILTDGPFFGGTLADLQAAREATEASRIPVLRKDFAIDEIQVYETRAIGADALLLVVAALPHDAHLADLHALAVELGLGVLVETHDAFEIDRALDIGARVIGVNARDLGTFTEHLDISEALASRLPPEVIGVAESAIRSVDDAWTMAAAGYDAVLVGEMLVKADDPTATVRELAGVRRGSR